MKLLLSFIILILSYYPVYANNIHGEEALKIVANGEIISTEHQGFRLKTFVKYKGEVYFCELNGTTSTLGATCTDSKRTNKDQ